MIIYLLLLIFFLAVFEASVMAFPFTLLAVLIISVMTKKAWVFPLAFLCGIMLDLLKLTPAGKTSIFITSFLFIILLYNNKFEIRTVPFVFFASFLGSLSYFAFFGYQNIVPQAVASSIIGVISFIIAKKIMKIEEKSALWV